MKTVVFPERTEFIGEADDGVWAAAGLVKAAIAQAKGQILVSSAPRKDDQGETCDAVISRPLPRVGQAIRLTVGETVAGVFPAGDGAEDLIVHLQHSADCPCAKKARADCICAAMLTLRKRGAGH